MKRSSLSGIGVVLALAAILLLPAAVQAAEDPASSLVGFRLEATNGYVFYALTEVPPEGEEEGWIGLFLGRGKHTRVSYAAPATVSRTTLEADLGKLGRISVTRVPTGRMKTVPQGCKRGSTKRVEAERYEGTIEFHGEEGFAEVNATSVPLESLRPCGNTDERGGTRDESKILPGARLDVEKRVLDKYRLEFTAVQRRPGARTRVSVEVEEHRGEIEIHRATWTWGDPGALRFHPRLRTATVRLPAPFSGHGSFHADAPRPGRWTGNLTVDLPGRANVPVTGPGFSADLERPYR